MKVAELREKLSKMKKEELIKVASEFYKLIPKAKKEDYGLDDFINNPSKRQKKASSKQALTLDEIQPELRTFIANAKEQYYLYPNKVVPKKERSTWRFKVKKWYKELINVNRADKDIHRQAQLLLELYELMCESCGYEYFTAYDPFESIGIAQSDFYRSVISLLHEAKGKLETVQQAITLIVYNYLNRYTLYSSLMKELIATFESVDLKYKGIEVAEKLIEKNNFQPKKEKNSRFYWHSTEEFNKKERHNNLVEFVLRLRMSLQETEEGIEFYQKHHYQ
ncbi:MAG: hypothetical protein AAF599_07705, partial [Bacteroidota bacterium]